MRLIGFAFVLAIGACRAASNPSGTDCDDGALDNVVRGGWSFSDLQGGNMLQGSASLTHDSAGTTHACFAVGSVYHASRSGQEWSVDVVEDAGLDQPGWGGSIAIDPSSTPDDPRVVCAHVSRDAASDDARIRVDRLASRAWTGETITTIPRELDWAGAEAERTAIAVDGSGSTHLFFREAETLRYATDRNGPWRIETIDDEPGAGLWAQAELDADGALHVAYLRYREDPGPELRHATNAAGTWSIEPVADDGWVVDPSMALGVDGSVHLVFGHWRPGAWELRHATDAGGSWSTDTLETGDAAGAHTSVDVDAAGFVHASWQDADGDLAYATNASGAWARDEIDSNEPTGYWNALQLDRAGVVDVLFASTSPDRVRVATNRAAPDGVDQDCDGVDGADADGDGFASGPTGGADCVDEDDSIHPDAPDPLDGIDRDCDGQD